MDIRIILLSIFIFFCFSTKTYAQTIPNYVTIVNPVRARIFWKSYEAVVRQINLIIDHKLPSTWLLHYSLLDDKDAIRLFQKLPDDQELGIFLEVDEILATQAKVAYKIGDGDWARADKVLLSGYNSQERKRMIDEIFSRFQNRFGYYPKSVGSWYIDTVSLNYLAVKYNVRTVLNVSDQYQTDTYGLWGTPWGTPYYPSKLNSLMPAKDRDRLDVVRIQWAQRDPVKGYGLTVSDSTYSLQANDYSRHNYSISYFQHLIDSYLFTSNVISQVTVGLEVGQEGADYYDEFVRQILYLRNLEQGGKIRFAMMSEFFQIFKNTYPSGNPNFLISGSDFENPQNLSFWYSTPYYRIGLFKKDDQLSIRDLRLYPKYFFYEDIVKSDASHILKRIIPGLIDTTASDKPKILYQNISNVSLNSEDNNLTLLITGKNERKHLLVLGTDAVRNDGEILFSYQDFKLSDTLMTDVLSGWLIDYQISKPHNWRGHWSYSLIDGIFYFGLVISPQKLLGANSQFPFLGIYHFPFQTLTRFRRLRDPDVFTTLSENFINQLNNSTIYLTNSHKL